MYTGWVLLSPSCMLFDYLGVLRGEEKYKKIIFFAFFLKNSLSVQKKAVPLHRISIL